MCSWRKLILKNWISKAKTTYKLHLKKTYKIKWKYNNFSSIDNPSFSQTTETDVEGNVAGLSHSRLHGGTAMAQKHIGRSRACI